jgi:hypothetical protein
LVVKGGNEKREKGKGERGKGERGKGGKGGKEMGRRLRVMPRVSLRARLDVRAISDSSFNSKDNSAERREPSRTSRIPNGKVGERLP